MIAVGVSQRREEVAAYDEQRAQLDERWPRLLRRCGMLAVPLPHDPVLAVELASELSLQALLLTGGGDLVRYGGDPVREATERALLAWALSGDVPVLGVCRGMQLILDVYGQDLAPVDGHVRSRHELAGPDGGRTVNSFHRLAALDAPAPLRATAWAGDVIEAVEARDARLRGVMWHPEREPRFETGDEALLRRALGAT